MCTFGCKKERHNWVEIGPDGKPIKKSTISIAPGVHPERGSESNATKVILAPIYYPVGRDKDGNPKYKKYLYELEELTPETIDLAMKDIALIDESSLFCDLVIEDSEEILSAGPGGKEASLTKKGIVRYVDLGSPADNSDSYEGKYYVKDLIGLIDQHDIEHCITETFRENFQLVSCTLQPVDMDVYREVHKNDKSKNSETSESSENASDTTNVSETTSANAVSE